MMKIKAVIISNVEQPKQTMFTPDFGGLIITDHVLGGKGVARHVCEIEGRHGLESREFGNCSVSKV